MFRCFFPDEYLESAYAVNYEKLYQEGVRGLLFDIDNTLVPHGARQINGQWSSLSAFAKSDLKAASYQITRFRE